MKLSAIAERIDCRLEGDGNLDIRGVAAIEQAGPGDLTFCANQKYAARLSTTAASAVIVGPSAPSVQCARLVAADPYLAFARAVALFAPPVHASPGVHRLADVSPKAAVAADASIGAFVSVGDGARIGTRTIVYPHVTIGEGASIGDDCVVHARVSVRERVAIGHRVVIQDGAVIGSDGFGFAHRADGTHVKILQ
ncbi:MAG: LpxD N-terminal domain-containing protein, partial [Vicinamibacterales bacterium]